MPGADDGVIGADLAFLERQAQMGTVIFHGVNPVVVVNQQNRPLADSYHFAGVWG
jgi:hypothetical protein